MRRGSLTGEYSGVTEDGSNLRLALREEPGGVLGFGTFDGAPIGFVQEGRDLVAGRLVLADGRTMRAVLERGADGALKVMAPIGEGSLMRTGEAPRQGPGPFGGAWATSNGLELALATQQSGNLLVGNAHVFGQPAAFTGWSPGPGTFQGEIIFANDSSLLVEGELADGVLWLRGLGSELRLER